MTNKDRRWTHFTLLNVTSIISRAVYINSCFHKFIQHLFLPTPYDHLCLWSSFSSKARIISGGRAQIFIVALKKSIYQSYNHHWHSLHGIRRRVFPQTCPLRMVSTHSFLHLSHILHAYTSHTHSILIAHNHYGTFISHRQEPQKSYETFSDIVFALCLPVSKRWTSILRRQVSQRRVTC